LRVDEYAFQYLRIGSSGRDAAYTVLTVLVPTGVRVLIVGASMLAPLAYKVLLHGLK
jgi:hypothetical protein